MKPAEIRLSLQRPLQHRDPTMTPTITAATTNSQEHLTLTHKLRKPLVEKLRRERINGSIEQLRSFLGPEFLKQQPDSKLEKADILEMTVCLLRRLQQQRRATKHFSHPDKNLREADFSPLSSTVQSSSTIKDQADLLWRPW